LTFDDGPDPEHTPILLDVLKSLGVVGTFFVIGQQARKYPDLVRRIAAEGHLVGHHSYSHAEPSQTTSGQLLDEVHITRRLLTDLLGKPPVYFRPPHGKLTVAKLWSLWRARQTIVLWNVDPRDWASHSSHEVQDWFARRPLRGGDVVLMHDNHPHAGAALPAVVAAARQRGISFGLVSQWAI
jgi:peptidoglycan/xylan/chitin deacetylase (PgdA/CDA1 family)